VTNLLAPVPKAKFFDNNGRPAVGYKLFTYEAGTNTKLDTYPDANTSTPNTNPIILDYRGEANVWMPPNVAYKLLFAPPNDTDPPTAPIWTVDDIVQSQLLTLYGGVDTGIANAYVVDFVSNFTSLTDGIVLYFLASNQNTGASTLNVNGLGPAPILTANGAALAPGQIAPNQMTGVIFRGGSWYLITVSVLAGSFTATLTGMTTTITGTVNYRISGGICSLSSTASISGISNANAMNMTGIPAVCQPVASRSAVSNALDNNTLIYSGCIIQSFGTIGFQPMTVSGSRVVPGTFTTSGVKGIFAGWNITYSL